MIDQINDQRINWKTRKIFSRAIQWMNEWIMNRHMEKWTKISVKGSMTSKARETCDSSRKTKSFNISNCKIRQICCEWINVWMKYYMKQANRDLKKIEQNFQWMKGSINKPNNKKNF